MCFARAGVESENARGLCRLVEAGTISDVAGKYSPFGLWEDAMKVGTEDLSAGEVSGVSKPPTRSRRAPVGIETGTWRLDEGTCADRLGNGNKLSSSPSSEITETGDNGNGGEITRFRHGRGNKSSSSLFRFSSSSSIFCVLATKSALCLLRCFRLELERPSYRNRAAREKWVRSVVTADSVAATQFTQQGLNGIVSRLGSIVKGSAPLLSVVRS